ncbi:23S rRNA (adenine(2030)-N(6))-methyltransferase RlmJ [Marinagarivorans algicola]|uniref:23S rRNA (adenine(2030)-N(6))-methyltransferase RlmJ n=1 Tax=Marinagarivorans algicola TaxID=1513270 RepID=UPI0006B4E7BE|nr:23S rRNA (adenine(2030)-N(6))-methyltransferase RlmJ [Marinagarivorans algicola]
MLSYRHAYHAGNSADVLKHFVIERILDYLVKKPKPCLYIDTHAGAGRYALGAAIANKTAEYQSGIAQLLRADSPPEVMQQYLQVVKACTAQTGEWVYPGSPWVAAHCLRANDRLALCELHPQDAPLLIENFKRDRRVKVYCEDGFTKSLALLPPAQRRGLTVIDPSYEIKADYDNVVEHIKALHRRFATGVYALWYPVVEAARITRLESRFKQAGFQNTQLFELQTYAGDKPGMYASGMIVVNAPWTLKADVTLALPWLTQVLGQDSHATYRAVTLCGES